MNMDDIVAILNQRAEEVALQEISTFQTKNPSIELTAEAKDATKERAATELAMELGSFHFREDADVSVEDQFKAWLEDGKIDHLRKSCQECLRKEAEKIKIAGGKGLSKMDAYLKKHLGDVHVID